MPYMYIIIQKPLAAGASGVARGGVLGVKTPPSAVLEIPEI